MMLMDNTQSQLSSRKPGVLVSLIVVLSVIVLPVVGIILIWTISRWATFLKVIATVLGALWILPCAIFSFALFYNHGSFQPFLDQDKMALSYLAKRYNEEFVVGASTGGDQLGGAVTFSKWVSPISDSSVKFRVYKCLARCWSDYESQHTNFGDDYIDALWSKQATVVAQDELGSNMNPGVLRVHVKLGLKDDAIGNLLNKDTGKVLDFSDRPGSSNAYLGYSLQYSERLAEFSVDAKNVVADKLLVMQNYAKAQNTERAGNISATIITNPVDNESGKGQHYYRYNLSESILGRNLSKQDILTSFEEVRYSGRP